MEKEKSPGGNQGLKKIDKDITGLKEKNQHQFLANTAEIETFFRTLFCNATGGYISLRGFHLEGGIAFSAESYLFDDPNLFPAASRLPTHAASLSGIVFCSATATFKESNKARGIDIFNGVSLSVDLDETHPQEARELLETILGPPTIVVASGGEWEHKQTGEFIPKLHLHWRLILPTTSPKEHEELNDIRKLAAKVAKEDPSTGPLAHPMRLPGSWHTKSQTKICKILECRNDVEISLEYAKERLHNYREQEGIINIKTDIKSFTEPKNTGYGKKALIEELCGLSNAQKGERNNRLNYAAFRLGQLVAHGDLDESFVANSLLSTAINIGLKQTEAYQTIQSGLMGGKCKTRIIIEQEKPQKATLSIQKFPFIKASDLKINPPKLIVEDYFEENSLSIVFGDPCSGKTFIALSLAASIATGCLWYRKCNRGKCLLYSRRRI